MTSPNPPQRDQKPQHGCDLNNYGHGFSVPGSFHDRMGDANRSMRVHGSAMRDDPLAVEFVLPCDLEVVAEL